MKNNSDQLEETLRKEAQKREKKKNPKMRVSGKSVFKLEKIMRNKKK